jgi:outer membrane receptor protein involved in Fe transport
MANVALEYEGAFDMDGLSRNAFSPSADLRFTAFKGLDIVAFGRRAYRIPTFNELYYVGYGNPELRAEDAWLTDIGIDFHRTCPSGWAFVTKADAFLNLLKNKITSAPTKEDPAIWAPYNIGKVRSAGMDLLVGMSYESGFLKASADARYTYQSAVDKTPDSYTFGQQIPYIARHTMIVSASLEWRGWRLDPVWQLRSGRSDGAGELPDYNTLDLNFSKSMNLHRMGQLMFRLSVKNILDSRYETVSGYPMPGRSIIGGIEYKF